MVGSGKIPAVLYICLKEYEFHLVCGVNTNHRDLMDNLWMNVNEIPNNGLDDDFIRADWIRNGYLDVFDIVSIIIAIMDTV